MKASKHFENQLNCGLSQFGKNTAVKLGIFINGLSEAHRTVILRSKLSD